MALAPHMTTQNPTEYQERIKALYIKPPNESAVRGVSISFGDRITVRIKRDPKYVTTDEIQILADEYGKTYEEIYALLSKKTRKIEIREGKNAQLSLKGTE